MYRLRTISMAAPLHRWSFRNSSSQSYSQDRLLRIRTPDSTLINGRGRYVGGPLVPLPVIDVLPNKRYR